MIGYFLLHVIFICCDVITPSSAFTVGLLPVQPEDHGYFDYPLWFWHTDGEQPAMLRRSNSGPDLEKRSHFDPILFRKRTLNGIYPETSIGRSNLETLAV
ncbi:hypothetical protein CSKR_200494 [Clonorchis sinensis]|uniref:Secreted protein n=1 Tax=Clonorchis sinensis TaxID=79923 RepID=A0A8T1MEC9_CLOSI|nr:hypothetical protein CSKR_200494 [Clonorchis sinensis]